MRDMSDAAENKSDISRARIWVDADACPVVIKEILFREQTPAALATGFFSRW